MIDDVVKMFLEISEIFEDSQNNVYTCVIDIVMRFLAKQFLM